MKATDQEFKDTHIKFIQTILANPVPAVEATLDEGFDVVKKAMMYSTFTAWAFLIALSLPSDDRVKWLSASIEVRILVATMHRGGYSLEDILAVTSILGSGNEALSAAGGALAILCHQVQKNGANVTYMTRNEKGEPEEVK